MDATEPNIDAIHQVNHHDSPGESRSEHDMLTASTLAGLTPQVAQPTDVFEFIAAARRDLSGTDYPGALALGHALVGALRAKGATTRELRVFAARWTVALEGYDDEAHAAKHYVVDALADLDFKALS